MQYQLSFILLLSSLFSTNFAQSPSAGVPCNRRNFVHAKRSLHFANVTIALQGGIGARAKTAGPVKNGAILDPATGAYVLKAHHKVKKLTASSAAAPSYTTTAAEQSTPAVVVTYAVPATTTSSSDVFHAPQPPPTSTPAAQAAPSAAPQKFQEVLQPAASPAAKASANKSPSNNNKDNINTNNSSNNKASSLESLALQSHNSFRSTHGASAMTWSDDLAKKAQSWADKCVFEHSGGVLGPLGENLAALSGTNNDIGQGIKLWTDEESEYNPSNPVASHFTQVVWKSSNVLGCAVQACNLPNFDPKFWPVNFYVCEYSAQGNVGSEFGSNVQA